MIIIGLPVAKPDASQDNQVLHSVSKRTNAGRLTQEAVCNPIFLAERLIFLLLRNGTDGLFTRSDLDGK